MAEEERKKKEVSEEETEETEEIEEREEEFESGFDQGGEMTTASERKAHLLPMQAQVQEVPENLEEKLANAPDVSGSETEKKKEEITKYVTDEQLYEKKGFYDPGIETERPRPVELAHERMIERLGPLQMHGAHEVRRFENRPVQEFSPEQMEYKSEKTFLEFNPLKELTGHGRHEEVKKYRRH